MAPTTDAQQTGSAGASGHTSLFVRNWTRAEAWRFFEPHPGGGDPDYGDIANRLQFGVRREARRYEFLGALQYVQFGGLPTGAVGPGELGVGAAYYGHSGRTDSRQLYLRYLHLRLKELAPGLSVQVGRMGFTGGAEITSADPKIETVKRQRVTSRLLGEFEWSIYQRGYDGLRVDWDRRDWHVSAEAFSPTQGGFEEVAGRRMPSIHVFAASLTARPGGLAPGAETQLFAYRYNDRRGVAARPDNSGRPADRVDV